jgi:hypothetical protein
MVKLRDRKGVLKTTPGKRGYVLPIGMVGDDNKIHKNFSIGEMFTPEEEAIGRFKEKNPEAIGTFVVSKVVALLLKSIGNIKYDHTAEITDPLEEAKALNQIGLMYFADVYYIYLMARINELGKEYKLDFQCANPNCKLHKEPSKLIADLNEVDTFCVEDTKLLRQKVKLIKGINYKNKLRKSVTVQPMLWMHMVGEDMKKTGGDPTLLKLHFMKNCVVGVEGVEEPIVLGDSNFDSLRKIDIERISETVHELNMGPSFILKDKCPECEFPFMYPVDTDYENFFSTSSL